MRPGVTTVKIIVEPGSDEDLDSPTGSVSDQQEKRLPYYFLLSVFIIIDVVLAFIIRGSGDPGSGNKKKEGADHSRN